jgi:hypothetical protein
MNTNNIVDSKLKIKFNQNISYPTDEINDCWIWLGKTINSGYGYLSTSKNPILAHRFSLLLHTNKPAPEKKVVMHKCDNPICVNPHHLSYGTQLENVRDKIEKNRHNYNKTKIDENTRYAIIKRYNELGDYRHLISDLVREFNIERRKLKLLIDKERIRNENEKLEKEKIKDMLNIIDNSNI